jgi:hypothetical protein
MPAEEAKGHAMTMPETVMPEMARQGKTIAHRELAMPLQRHNH